MGSVILECLEEDPERWLFTHRGRNDVMAYLQLDPDLCLLDAVVLDDQFTIWAWACGGEEWPLSLDRRKGLLRHATEVFDRFCRSHPFEEGVF